MARPGAQIDESRPRSPRIPDQPDSATPPSRAVSKRANASAWWHPIRDRLRPPGESATFNGADKRDDRVALVRDLPRTRRARVVKGRPSDYAQRGRLSP